MPLVREHPAPADGERECGSRAAREEASSRLVGQRKLARQESHALWSGRPVVLFHHGSQL
jgi:hypothetical protein